MSASSETPTNSGEAATPAKPEGPTLARIVAAANYTDHVAAIAERIGEARDQATVHALLTEGVHALGAEHAVFVSFVRDNADLSACRFMLVCEPDWCRRYLEAGCFAHDPWLAYAAHHSEPIVASSLPVLDAEGQRVIALAMQNGFASAALVPATPGSACCVLVLPDRASSRAKGSAGSGWGPGSSPQNCMTGGSPASVAS